MFEGTVSMQSKQRWDKYKLGVISEDHECITNVSTLDSQWDHNKAETTDATRRSKVVVDANNFLSRNVSDGNNNLTLSSLNTKVEEDGIHVI